MDEEIKETPAEEETPEVEEPQEEPQNEELEKARKVAEDQKRRAEKAEREAKDTKKKLEELAKSQPQDTEVQRNLDARAYADLLHEGYSREQIAFVENVAKSQNMQASEVIEEMAKEDSSLSYVKTAIDSMKERERAAQSVPPPSQSAPVKVGGKDFNEMSSAERARNWPQITEQLKQRHSGKGKSTL